MSVPDNYAKEMELEERNYDDTDPSGLDWTDAEHCPDCGKPADQCVCPELPLRSDGLDEDRFNIVVDCSAGWNGSETGVQKGRIEEVVTRLLDEHPDECPCGGNPKAHVIRVTG